MDLLQRHLPDLAIAAALAWGSGLRAYAVIFALGLAGTKASLVVIFFMGVRYHTPLTKVVVIGGFFWLFILFGLGMMDYISRPWLGVPGR